MGFYALIRKDLAEHGWIIGFLGLGLLVCLLLARVQNIQAISGVSQLQIVRVALMSLLPLICFILGQRLIVREYLGRTRLFAESLPIRGITLVSAKYFFGLFFVCLLTGLMLSAVAYSARIVDSIDQHYFLLLLAKSLSIATLVWSVVFCLSFCGFIRIALYTVIIFVVIILMNHPAYDAARFAPFALLDSQLFVFEREEVPWSELVQTLIVALLVSVVGFVLALFNEGSLAEVLAKPMSRRDFVVTGLIVVVGLLLMGKLMREPVPTKVEMLDTEVVRSVDPVVAINYRSAEYKSTAQDSMAIILAALRSSRQVLGISTLPAVAITQDNDLEPTEVQIDSGAGINLRVNFLGHDSFADYTLATVVMHEVLQYRSSRRLNFEPFHWLLDGFSRWWIETQQHQPTAVTPIKVHDTELLALAAHALARMEADWTLDAHWQLLTDRVGYPAAEALAYSTIRFLNELQGRAAVESLALSVLGPSRSTSSAETVKTWMNTPAQQFLSNTAIELPHFFSQWQEWLQAQAGKAPLETLLNQIPALTGEVTVDSENTNTLVVSLTNTNITAAAGSDNNIERTEIADTDSDQRTELGQCRLQYQTILPFDHEMEPLLKEREELSCDLSTYSVQGFYSPGDRVYIVLEHLHPSLHAPLRLWQGRVNIP